MRVSWAGAPNAAGVAGRMTVCPRDDGGISTSAAQGFSWSTRRDGVVSADSWDARTDRERTILTASAPLVQPRVRVLGEVAGMVGSLLSTDGYLEPDADARKQLKDSAGDVLAKAIAALEGVDEADWATDALHDLLTRALVDEGGYKPRLAFGPVRVALSGRRVSPPLFESMEIVGKDVTVARLKGLREHL